MDDPQVPPPTGTPDPDPAMAPTVPPKVPSGAPMGASPNVASTPPRVALGPAPAPTPLPPPPPPPMALPVPPPVPVPVDSAMSSAQPSGAPTPPAPAAPTAAFPASPAIESKRVLAGVTAILFGFIGLHKFILGYTGEGVVMLLVTFVGGFCTAGVSILATATIGFIEGIVYLSKSDAEFVREYQVGRKEWF